MIGKAFARGGGRDGGLDAGEGAAESLGMEESFSARLSPGKIPAKIALRMIDISPIHDISPAAPVHLLVITRRSLLR